MYIFYIIALIPAIIGTILFMFNRKIVWQEWLLNTAVSFILSAIVHGIAIYNMTSDIETLSGKITHSSYFPRWIEEYEESHTRSSTDSKGNTTYTTYYTTEHHTHEEHWVAYLNFGTINEEREISSELFNEIKSNFGNSIQDGGKQSYSHGGDFDGGDNNIYNAINITGYVYPVTTIKRFENKIKASPTLFSFVKVPTNIVVYNWPSNPNWMSSERLINTTSINIREFDLMNSRLGFKRRVNVILIGFNNSDPMIGQYQEAKWIGGKKNDLVLCYGYQGSNVVWTYVFGWTEKEICKRNLETILLNNLINNDILLLIEKEISENYIIKDWTKFDYITIEPPKWALPTLIILMFLTQIALWIWSCKNDFTKDGENRYSTRRYL